MSIPEDPILLIQRTWHVNDNDGWQTVLRFPASKVKVAQRFLAYGAHLDPEVVWRFAHADGQPVTPESMEV